MIRTSLTLLLPLALLLAGCQDRPLPTALPAEGPLFSQLEASPVVNSMLDDVLPTAEDAGCTEAKCTLRSAIAFASSGATISFSVTGTLTLTQGQLLLDKNLTITGPGANLLTVARSTEAGTPQFRIFQIASGVTVTISGLTITGGRGSIGGGIYNQGALTLTHSTVSGNSADFSGGGIFNQGTLTLTHSTVSGNRSLDGGAQIGGGILNSGTLTLTHSTVSGNSAVHGGGIYNFVGGTLTLTHSTVSGNSASSFGGGIYNFEGTLTLTHSTVSGNSAVHIGGGIFNFGALTLTSSLIAGNTASSTGPDILHVDGTVTASYSLIGSTAGNGITATAENGNLIDIASGLELDNEGKPRLADNGGPTKTHALQAGSPAIDHIPQGTNGCGTSITTDQRGITRPQGSGCDIGAFELEQSTTPAFGGFRPPVREGQLNVMKAGRAVPVKFSLGGDFGLGIFESGYPRSVPITCPGAGVARNTVGGTTSARESRLTYDTRADQYNYLWVTSKAWAGTCRRFEVKFVGDANSYTLDFSFTR